MPRQSIPPEIRSLLPKITSAAQRVYDDWQQDEDGLDEELGDGGICHMIADAIVGLANDAGVMSIAVASTHDVHVYTVMRLASGVWLVDIRPHVYERGGGYRWKKIAGVVFEPGDVTVEHLDRDPSQFRDYVYDFVESESS